MAGSSVGPRDRAVIAGELGRTPHDLTGVAVRCPFGYPAVIETAPVLSDGAPNPTLFYVTCPALAVTISRAEAGGAVRDLRSSCRRDASLRDLLEQITRAYRERRSALHEGAGAATGRDPRLGAGIGGSEGPETASCLHAYAAALLAVRSGWLVPEESQAIKAAGDAWARFLPPVQQCWCTDARCAQWDPGERRAAIDVGTISVRVLVADLTAGRPVAVVRQAEVTRLGEGLEPGGSLSEAARLRTAEVVERFATQARLLGAENVQLAATSAAREATDGREFIEGLGLKHGLEAVVLSGEREAELAYAGACLDVADPVVLDVGGGSTELITRLPTGRLCAVSLPLGASRATEKWVKSDPPAAEELQEVAVEAAGVLAKVGGRFGAHGKRAGARRLVGVAGTVTTLAALATGLEVYDPEAIHLRTLSLDEVRRLLTRLAGLSNKERAALPCVQAGRAPVIVAGTAIVLAAMEGLGYDELTVSERDLLDGLVMEGA